MKPSHGLVLSLVICIGVVLVSSFFLNSTGETTASPDYWYISNLDWDGTTQDPIELDVKADAGEWYRIKAVIRSRSVIDPIEYEVWFGPYQMPGDGSYPVHHTLPWPADPSLYLDGYEVIIYLYTSTGVIRDHEFAGVIHD